MSFLVVTHNVCLEHKPNEGHPEQPERLVAVLHSLKEAQQQDASFATEDFLELVHKKSMIEKNFSLIPQKGLWALDDDTIISSQSGNAALYAAGAGITAIDLLMKNRVNFVFCAIRPPGHHASKTKPAGFCMFNNVALAARYGLNRYGLKRIAIVDFDVHHGDGTQDIFWDDPRVLFISSHQEGLYPNTGAADETGAHGNILNIPLPAGSDGQAMRKAYEELAFPRLRAFEPEMLLISAGFDAHRDDPLANLNWNEDDYFWLGQNLHVLSNECCGDRAAAFLEGGYNVKALASSVRAFTNGFEG